MELPSYPKIFKKPSMDLSTMRRKIDNRDYPTAEWLYDDFKHMVKNCMLFNPLGAPVCTAGQELDKVFLEKRRNLPPLYPLHAIAQMEARAQQPRAAAEERGGQESGG
ncbi:hypothetical protein FA13DRAFT_1802142 [Coprinellus micaceus]|jgi:bromodomain-containing factor 1|uniref:Bromo domain-containing protein n=1 Tax=Coprinellus micaceus TaxID=71717 RepID=A0A4Y7SCP5_COPMI|nr:hypothetical protein FA13DRAFT_1802133 [Coprinellus micaceus]TEB19504.1 hypothetical protein FA13DRAFT_1802142 [Coprinellus micaceus]